MDLSSPFNFDLPALGLIQTPTGIFFVEKLHRNQPLLGNQDKEQSVANLLPVGMKAVRAIKLKNGQQLLLGEKNQVYTFSGWKDVKDLVVGDHVLHKLSFFQNLSPGGKTIGHKNVLLTSAMPILVPETMTPEFAKWLGMFSVLGRVVGNSAKIVFSSRDKKVVEEFNRLTTLVFRISLLKDKFTDQRHPTEYYFQSRNLVNFLQSWMGSQAMRKVPTFLLEGSAAEQLAFIEGLSAVARLDGKYVLLYRGLSKMVADFVSLVLRNLGYVVYQQVNQDERTNSIYYKVKLVNQHPQAVPLTFLPESLQAHLQQKLMNTLVSINSYWERLKPRSFDPGYEAWVKMKTREPKVCTWQVAKALGVPEAELQYYYVKVESVETRGMVKTVALKTLYPEGLLFNHVVLAGYY